MLVFGALFCVPCVIYRLVSLDWCAMPCSFECLGMESAGRPYVPPGRAPGFIPAYAEHGSDDPRNVRRSERVPRPDPADVAPQPDNPQNMRHPDSRRRTWRRSVPKQRDQVPHDDWRPGVGSRELTLPEKGLISYWLSLNCISTGVCSVILNKDRTSNVQKEICTTYIQLGERLRKALRSWLIYAPEGLDDPKKESSSQEMHNLRRSIAEQEARFKEGEREAESLMGDEKDRYEIDSLFSLINLRVTQTKLFVLMHGEASVEIVEPPPMFKDVPAEAEGADSMPDAKGGPAKSSSDDSDDDKKEPDPEAEGAQSDQDNLRPDSDQMQNLPEAETNSAEPSSDSSDNRGRNQDSADGGLILDIRRYPKLRRVEDQIESQKREIITTQNMMNEAIVGSVMANRIVLDCGGALHEQLQFLEQCWQQKVTIIESVRRADSSFPLNELTVLHEKVEFLPAGLAMLNRIQPLWQHQDPGVAEVVTTVIRHYEHILRHAQERMAWIAQHSGMMRERLRMLRGSRGLYKAWLRATSRHHAAVHAPFEPEHASGAAEQQAEGYPGVAGSPPGACDE